jgi:hypothetical protein
MHLTKKKRSSHSSAGTQVSKAPEKRTSQNLTLDHGGEFARHTQWVQDVWASDLIFATPMPPGKQGRREFKWTFAQRPASENGSSGTHAEKIR